VVFCAEPVAGVICVADWLADKVGAKVGVGELVVFFILGVGDGFAVGMTTMTLGMGILLMDENT